MPSVHNKYYNTAPAGAVYIGRPSPWGNQFNVQDHGREKAVELYREWLMSPDGKHIREKARKELRGKDLVCFCKPKECHGDWLLEVANYEPKVEELVGLGWGQWDGPGTEGYCRPIYSIPVSPDNEINQETHNDQEEGRQRS